MFPVSNHTSCETSTNTVKTSNPSAAKLVSDTRIVMRSISPQPTPHLSPTNSADLHLSDAPLLGTMKFNEEQKAFWKTHTRPEVSSKVQKLVMLRTIAHDQEKAGLHFDGRRSFAQAEVDLLQEQLIQTSQAARVQNPLNVIGEAAKNLAQSLENYFEGMPSIEEAVSHHDYISVQKGIAAFLDKHFNSARNDIFLAEAVMIFEEINGKEKVVAPSLEKHHEIFCIGIPLQSCRFLKEPEKEVAELSVALFGRRKMVNRIFEFLMKSIPLTKANEARKKLAKHNQAVVTVDTEIKVQLMIEYQKYCDLNKQKKLIRLGSVLEDETKKENAAHAATNNARDEAYLSQITKAIVDLKPGAKLYYLQGINHFRRLSQQLNRLNTFFIDPEISSEKEEL